MTTWRRVVGDTNDTIVAQLLAGGTPVDLTAVTAVEAHVWLGTAAATTLTAAVTTAATGIVTVQLSTSSWIATAAPGNWSFEIQTTATTIVRTWPEGTPDTIAIRAQGA